MRTRWVFLHTPVFVLSIKQEYRKQPISVLLVLKKMQIIKVAYAKINKTAEILIFLSGFISVIGFTSFLESSHIHFPPCSVSGIFLLDSNQVNVFPLSIILQSNAFLNTSTYYYPFSNYADITALHSPWSVHTKYPPNPANLQALSDFSSINLTSQSR